MQFTHNVLFLCYFPKHYRREDDNVGKKHYNFSIAVQLFVADPQLSPIETYHAGLERFFLNISFFEIQLLSKYHY